MDLIIGSGVVLVGALIVALLAMTAWGLIRALGDGKFVVAGLLLAALIAAGYGGQRGYVRAAAWFEAADYALDVRALPPIAPGEWHGDLQRLVGRRRVTLTTADGTSLRLTATAVELRKQRERIYQLWACSETLSSDDAADLARRLARDLNLNDATLDAWADRRRHSFERDPSGWASEHNDRRTWRQLVIDSDQRGFWRVKVTYRWR